jgi:hypothetical protein
MKKKLIPYIIAVTAFVVFIVLGSVPASSDPTSSAFVMPDIDYSRIGPNDSVILAYLDPKLIKTVTTMSEAGKIASSMLVCNVFVDGAQYYSPPLVGVIYNIPKKQLGDVEMPEFAQSFQMQIPNGSHTVHVVGQTGTQAKTDILPFEVAFDNVAITYKIRLATNEEKKAGGIGVGNEAYTMEEVALKRLR